MKLDTFTPSDGAYPPATGEILIERVAMNVANTAIGQTATLRIPGSDSMDLYVSGSVHAPGLAPAWMEGFAYGFITQETYELLGGRTTLIETKIRLDDYDLSQEEVKSIIYDYKDILESQGITVEKIKVPVPGRHPHYTQLMLLLYLMEIFGIIAVVLSSVLIANMISAILEQQRRQIGILKAIGGATTRQIFLLYMSMVLLLATIATAIALPLGISLGRNYAEFAATMLNFDIFDDGIPSQMIYLQILISYIIPVVITCLPILKSTRISVRESLSDYGINLKSSTDKESILGKMMPRNLILAIRNTFRKKRRV